MCRTISLWLGTLTLLFLVVEPAWGKRVHEGHVIKAGAGKLTMVDHDYGDRRTHPVSPYAKITLDGQLCKLEALRPGDLVKVTMRDDTGTALKIEALSRIPLAKKPQTVH